MNRFVVTQATDADVPGIQLAAAESWRAAYTGIFSPDFIESFVGHAYSSDSLRRVIRSPRSIFVVARDEGELVGFSHAGYGPRNAELYRIYLRPAWWGSGAGEQLLRHCEEWLRAEGYAGYGCFVHLRNTIGSRFYEKQGFRHLPEYDDGDNWYYWKDLE